MKEKTVASFHIDPKSQQAVFSFSLEALYYLSSLIPYGRGGKRDIAAEVFDDAIDQLEKLIKGDQEEV